MYSLVPRRPRENYAKGVWSIFKDVSHASFRRRTDSSQKVLSYAKSIVGVQHLNLPLQH